MSLDGSPQLLAEAENGEVRKEDFAETVRTPLLYAYDLATHPTGEPRSSTAREFAGNPPTRNAALLVHQLPQQREHLAAGHRVQRPRHQDRHRHRRTTPEVKYP